MSVIRISSSRKNHIKSYLKALAGDTIIEVLLATTIFSFVAISCMVIINSNTNNIEANLELTMVRAEIDAQAEAIRFIHDAYVAEGDFAYHNNSSNSTRSPYHRLWQRLTNNATDAAPGLISKSAAPTALMDCSKYYDGGGESIYSQDRHAYVINTRNLAVAANQNDSNWFSTSNLNTVIVPATSPGDDNNKFSQASTYARVVYGSTDQADSLISDDSTEVKSAEGIWVITVPDQSSTTLGTAPQFYDFHVYTCWYGPGRDVPTTIGTILRLYNPRYRS